MIKLEHVVLPSPEQMKFVIEGMRNPMNSWDKSDSNCIDDCMDCSDRKYCEYAMSSCGGRCYRGGDYIGPNDLSLMKKLSAAGTDHRKFMRMMPVMVRITAPLYWWKEFDTYKVGTVANSCSTMHKITEKEFDISDFSTEQLISSAGKHNDERDIPIVMTDEEHEYSPMGIMELAVISMLNECRNLYLLCNKKLKSPGIPLDERKELAELQKQYWWQLIQLLPSSYNQTRNVMLNYEVLANIYPSRKNHKLDEWQEFCKWIETLPYHELITGPDILRKELIIKED